MSNLPTFFIGLDIGKRQDYTALAILEYRRRPGAFDPVRFCRLTDWDLRVRRLVRFPLGTCYRELLRLIKNETRHPALPASTPVIVDATGVGEVVVDLLRSCALPLVPVCITAGDRSTHQNGRWHVPKQNLVDALAMLIEQDKLGLAAGLDLNHVFLSELTHFEATIRPTGRATFSARDDTHDDLVMAVALACWYFRWLYPDPAAVITAPPWFG